MSLLRDRLQRFDAGFLVVLTISFIALWPFLSRPDLPQETDAELHVFRLAELTRLVLAGELYPRWAPHFYYGYGYPIFNYYAPLTYYVGLVIDLLPYVDAVQATKAIFILSLSGGGVGTYGFVRDSWGRPAALVSSSLFLYAPYIQFVDPHARGALAELFSFGIFPLALWATQWLHRRPNGWRFVIATFLVSALILSHNLMGVVLFGLLLGWAIWQMAGEWMGVLTGARRSTPVFLSLLLGVLLSAFFWLPVVLEREAVNLNSLIGDGGNFDFRTHFLSLPTLLAPSQRLDWGATEPEFVFNLGVAQWILGSLSLVLLLTGRLQRLWQASYFALAYLLLIFLMLPISAPIWVTVPGMPFLQFPWRFLGPAAIILAILSGAGVERLLKHPRARALWIVPGIVGAVVISGLPMSQVPPWPSDFGPVNTRQLMEIELQGRWLGTTSTADFVPVTVELLPLPVDPLLDALRDGRPIDPVNRASLPEGTEVITETVTPLHKRFHVKSAKPFPLRLFIFDFPGWHTSVDGQPVQTDLGRPEGFIVIPVEAGEHVVEVFFGATPVRKISWLLSGGSLLLMIGLALVIDRRKGPVSDLPAALACQERRVLTATTGVVLLIAVVHILLIEPLGLLHYHSMGFNVIPADEELFVNFGDQIALIGYDSSGRVLMAGDEVMITLYWKAQEPPTINFQVFVHVLSEDGELVAQSDKLNPGEYPTKRWPLDRYVRDVHRLELPHDLAPGTYTISAGLWVQSEGWRLPVLGEGDRQTGDNATLFSLEVKDSARD